MFVVSALVCLVSPCPRTSADMLIVCQNLHKSISKLKVSVLQLSKRKKLQHLCFMAVLRLSSKHTLYLLWLLYQVMKKAKGTRKEAKQNSVPHCLTEAYNSLNFLSAKVFLYGLYLGSTFSKVRRLVFQVTPGTVCSPLSSAVGFWLSSLTLFNKHLEFTEARNGWGWKGPLDVILFNPHCSSRVT